MDNITGGKENKRKIKEIIDMGTMVIIPARGGSKGIPYKNIIDLNGMPLIYYVTSELLKTTEVDRIVISTDDIKIKSVVKNLFGNKVDVLDRPAEISNDVATSEAVVDHAIRNIKEKYEYTMLAQCTSPLTKSNDFTNLISAVKGCDSAAFYIEDDNLFFDIEGDIKILRSDRLPRQKRILKRKEVGNGWIFKTFKFLKCGCRLFGDVGLCKIGHHKSLEIDSMEDLKIIECLLKKEN